MKQLIPLVIALFVTHWSWSAQDPRILSTNAATGAISMHVNNKHCWTYNPTSEEGKPYFHPLTIPGSDTELTWYRPGDHKWHLGFWFSWKYINGINFWEPDTNAVRKVESWTSSFDEKEKIFRSAALLTYHAKGKQILTENRITTVTTTPEGDYTIDWDATFTVLNETLTFTSAKAGKDKSGIWSSGGYAGLMWRFAPTQNGLAYLFTDAEGRQDRGACGYESAWMNAIASNTVSGAAATIRITNHAENPQHPVTWFTRHSALPKSQSGGYNLIGPAVVFHKPLTIEATKSMRLRYTTTVQRVRK